MHNVIYSRRKIRLPKIIGYKHSLKNDRTVEKLSKIVVILLIAFSVVKVVVDAVNPIIDTLCEEQAKNIATQISNQEATNIMKKYEYADLFYIEKDEKGNITMVRSNVFPINQITSDIAINIQDRINETEKSNIKIPLGSFTGIKLISGEGPYINAKISTAGNVGTDVRSEFTAQGINQTLHRIYLQVDCKVNVLTPFHRTEENISNQVLLFENVIVGQIPETYYNLDGFTDANATLDCLQ